MVKLNKLVPKILMIGLALNLSCNDYVEDINEDPNRLTDSSAENMIQGVMIANQFFHTSGNVRDVMIWMGQAEGVDRQYITLNDWNSSSASNFDSSWNIAYARVLAQAMEAAKKAEIAGNPRLQGVAEVLEAHVMGTITSLWGDVPFRQANNYQVYPNPAYDPQAQVYSDLQTLLDNAITHLSKTNGRGIPADKDIYYGGTASKWIKLAHSLKARYYLHTKNYTMAKSEAQQGIASASDDFKAIYQGGTSYNPYYYFQAVRGYMSGEGYAMSLLDSSSSLYRGNTKTDETARSKFIYDGIDLNIGDGKFGEYSKLPLVTYGEMLLIIAEAEARTSFSAGLTAYNTYRTLLNTGYSIGSDDTGYNGESFSYTNYTATDFAAGGIENAQSLYSDQNALLKEIYEERYIYLLGSYESFTDFGRTNNLAGIVLRTVSKNNTPQRFIYPQVEINGNSSTPSPIPAVDKKTPVHL